MIVHALYLKLLSLCYNVNRRKVLLDKTILDGSNDSVTSIDEDSTSVEKNKRWQMNTRVRAHLQYYE